MKDVKEFSKEVDVSGVFISDATPEYKSQEIIKLCN